MLPVLIRFTFTSLPSQLLLYALALALVGAIAYNGWRGTPGTPNGKGGVTPPTPSQRAQRAALYALVAGVLVRFGFHYALPPTAPLFGGTGEGIPLHTYGILLASGFLCAVAVASRLAQAEWRKLEFVRGQWVDAEGPRKREAILDLSFWVLVGGLAGSRLLFMLVNWGDTGRALSGVFGLLGKLDVVGFVAGLLKFLVGGGGLVFYGGLIGAALMAYAFARRHGMDFLRLADLAIPTVSLGQALGRLGCFSAGCCWGDVAGSHVHWAAHFPGGTMAKDVFGRLGGTPSLAFQSQVADGRWVIESTGEIFHQAVPGAVRISEWVAQHGFTLPVHPTQLYESAGQTVLFVALLFLRRYRRFHGQIFGLWLMAYALLRTTVELFRGDVERGTLHGLLSSLSAHRLAEAVPLEAWYNISTSQFISLCMFTFGATLLYRKARQLMTASILGATPTPA